MKKKLTIEKSRLTPPADFTELWENRVVNGIELDYSEYDFITIDGGKAVLFDAYTASRRYAALDMECGVLAFPFSFTCMTDKGERVAYCGLRFSEDKITEWRVCHERGEAGMLLLANDPDALAVSIPSGVCVISSVPAYEEYEKHIKDELHPLAGSIILNGQTHESLSLYGYKYGVFSTGWGDGGYKCYKGTGADGRTVAVIVDFDMIESKAPEQKSYTELEVEVSDGVFVGDPNKSEPENNVERWTRALESTTEPESMLQAYSRRGYAYHAMNKLDEALCDYEAAINCCVHISDKSVLLRAWSVFDNAAELLCKNGDYDTAIGIMRFALSLGDNFYGGAYVRLVDMYFATKQYALAHEIAKSMLESRPDDPVAYVKYAEACVAVSDYMSAADAYETLASGFKLYENLFDEAACFIDAEEYERADSALERHPAKEYSEQYWYYKAFICYRKREYTQAVEYALKAHEIDREYLPALYLTMDIKTLMHDFNSVARLAEEYKKARPASEYGFAVSAEAHLINGNYSECVKNYCYLYSKILKNDKYAALAAIVSEKSGDTKHRAELTRALKKSRSPYYACVRYMQYASKYNDKAAEELARVLIGHKIEVEFLTLLATYCAGTGKKDQARLIMRELLGRDSSADSSAAQVRVALLLGDSASAERHFAYYAKRFLGEIGRAETELVAEGFASSCKLDAASVKKILLG